MKEGTETDPLKAFAVSQYRMKISGVVQRALQAPDGRDPVRGAEEAPRLGHGERQRRAHGLRLHDRASRAGTPFSTPA